MSKHSVTGKHVGSVPAAATEVLALAQNTYAAPCVSDGVDFNASEANRCVSLQGPPHPNRHPRNRESSPSAGSPGGVHYCGTYRCAAQAWCRVFRAWCVGVGLACLCCTVCPTTHRQATTQSWRCRGSIATGAALLSG